VISGRRGIEGRNKCNVFSIFYIKKFPLLFFYFKQWVVSLEYGVEVRKVLRYSA